MPERWLLSLKPYCFCLYRVLVAGLMKFRAGKKQLLPKPLLMALFAVSPQQCYKRARESRGLYKVSLNNTVFSFRHRHDTLATKSNGYRWNFVYPVESLRVLLSPSCSGPQSKKLSSCYKLLMLFLPNTTVKAFVLHLKLSITFPSRNIPTRTAATSFIGLFANPFILMYFNVLSEEKRALSCCRCQICNANPTTDHILLFTPAPA